MDPFEKYDMMFNGGDGVAPAQDLARPVRGMDNGWALALTQMALGEFDKSIVDFPNIKRFPGGASNDLIPESAESGEPAARNGHVESVEDRSSVRLTGIRGQDKDRKRGRALRRGARPVFRDWERPIGVVFCSWTYAVLVPRYHCEPGDSRAHYGVDPCRRFHG